MGAELRIESELDRAWAIHGEDHRQAVADRERLQWETQDRLGPEVAAHVQRHVDVALGRLLADDLRDLSPAAKRAYHQLLALETAVLEIESRIEAGCVFYDPYNTNGLLPTLGLSWWRHVAPLQDDGTSPGYMPVENVVKFLRMVKDADQRLPSGEGNDGTAGWVQKRWEELIEFLTRAVTLQEPMWCDL